MELDEIVVENLVPESCRGEMPIEEFFKRLAEHDDEFEEMRKAAEARREKLRYMAILDHGVVKIQLGTVGESHPFYSLSGSDNIILLTTERYHDRPMVIRGPGAGAGVTAAGVFADIIRIGQYTR
jgi:aspartokinase/homoserine dehydrogenase 1